MGRAISLYDHLFLPDELKEKIRKVTLDDIRRVHKQMMAQPVTCVCYGNTALLSDDPAKEIEKIFCKKYKGFFK